MADSGTALTESSLLSKLESSYNLSGIHQQFYCYLQDFSPVLQKQSNKPSKIDDKTLRSLAKKFISFLNKSLFLLPKRLNETPKIDSNHASELFDTYKLCLNCLDAISSQLSCKPHLLQIHRVRLLDCYGNWGRYEEAQSEGVSVLEFIRNLCGKLIGNPIGSVVPELGKENEDKDIALLILQVVVVLVKCVANVQSKEECDYRRVLSLVSGIQPWLRVIGPDESDKSHRKLVSYMSTCALFLVGEVADFDVNLTMKFCVETFSEHKRLYLNDQTEKFAQKICSSVFSQLDKEILCKEKILTLVLDTMANECKVGMEKANVDFLELVVYIFKRCRNATADFCSAVASHFKKLANYFSQVKLSVIELIIRLYAITLSTSDLIYFSRGSNTKISNAKNDISVPKLLLDVENQLQSLRFSTIGHTWTYISFYFDALMFLCVPLSELIRSKREDILCGFPDMSYPIKLPNIEDLFQQFRYVFDAYCKSEKEKYNFEDNSQAVLAIAIAALILSFTTKQNSEKSHSFIKQLISAEWVQASGLKYIYASLYNVGRVFYKADRLKEATEPLNLCCQAAWKCVLHFVSSKDESSSNLSKDAITAVVTETCAISAFFLDILYQCGTGSKEISMILIEFLQSWSVAQNWFDKIPIPVALVKQWVKMICKETKDSKNERGVQTMYSLMPSSKMSKQALGFLLEQELEAYRELKSLNPELCQTMQMTISNILLEDIYSTKDNFLHKSKILIAKARESRATGAEGLNDCIKYLSEAVSTMSELYNENKEACGSACNLLAEACCLRALCTQEAEPNSKYFIEDICYALKLWLSQEYSESAEQTQMMSHNTIILLYHVGDLLSLKGYMELRSDIYELMIRFFTCKNVSLKECLSMLWQSKSLSHALCISPVNDAFISTFSKHCKLSKSMEFWRSCMENSKSLEVNFQQCFSVITTISSPTACNHDHATKEAHLTVDDIKKTAFDLSNSVPLSNRSLFLSSTLYYGLSERMTLKGSMIEALFYAKEAHQMREKLFKMNFIYSIEQHNDIIGENGEVIQKGGIGITSFHMRPSVATTAWPNDKGSSDIDSMLTAYNVLCCYLESVLQIGTIQEILGNGSEAEGYLSWGKKISSFQGLLIFSVSFSTALGKLYVKQHRWQSAKNELESANHTLVNSFSDVSCMKCRLILEAAVDQQFGDLFSHFSSTNDNKPEDFSNAEIRYRSAAEKLKHSEWKNCISNPTETVSRDTMFCDSLLLGGNDVIILSDRGNQDEEAIIPKVTRKGKKATRNLPQEQRVTSRVTRSSKIKSENAQGELKRPQKSKVDRFVSCGCEVTCLSGETNCWHCVPSGVVKSSLLTSVVQMKWECTRRRLLVKLLIGLGNCLWASGETQRAHEVFLESISVLVDRTTFHPTKISSTFLGELINKNVIGDAFAVEHAFLLYNICWFSLRSSCDSVSRNLSFDMAFIPIPIVVSGLKQSFILCREVPELCQKVSRLLAVLYTLAPSNKAFSMLTFSSSSLLESQWASFFHQASQGTHVTYQMFSRLAKQKDQNTMDVDGAFPSGSAFQSLYRLAPQSVLDLEEFVSKVFEDLPRATIICISMLGDEYGSWLSDLLSYKPPTHSWMMFSRLNSDCAPIIVVLPIDSILAGGLEDNQDSSSDILFEKKSCEKTWHCPWGRTVVDEVAPLFKSILEESYLSSSVYATLEDTKQNRLLWWNTRRKLDRWLCDLLSDIEDLWFGPWKHLLLGGFSDQTQVDFLLKRIMKGLKAKDKMDMHEDTLKAVIRGGVKTEECIVELIKRKGCYIGGRECINDGSFPELLLKTMHEIGEDVVDREPVILVPDSEIQMLPWESLPILRNQEVYRMPSVASISCTYDRCSQFRDKDFSVSPMIDPLDAYYLLNPGGDLSNTEAEFSSWFNDQHLQGTAGTSPSVDELSRALKSHDLFIYIGHGSGVQYIPGDEIQKLDGCAATLLMGCSSGSLSLNGSYAPKGTPLYYLSAGSPVIIANLWDVTDKDIDRFCKTVLDGWIKARSNISVDCAQCTQLSDKFKDMKITDGGTRKGKKKISRSKSVEDFEVNTSTLGCKHKPKIGSFMGQARGACTLPFLIGAAPVCYGVPTGIRKKDM